MKRLDLNKNASKLFTRVYFKIRKSVKRFRVIYGGRGSSKSYSAEQDELIKLMNRKRYDTLVIRKEGVTHRDSTWKTFVEIIRKWGIYDEFIFNQSPDNRRITYKHNGLSFVFKGLDNGEKLKSIMGFQRCLIEEATQLTMLDFLGINQTLRAVPDIQITLLFNPIDENHWIKSLLVDESAENLSQYADVFRFTYHDNQFLTAEDIIAYEALKTIDENLYRVNVLAEWGIANKDRKFAFNFSKDKHVKPTQYNPNTGVWFSFDFNVNPMTCTVYQVDISARIIRGIEDIKLANSDIFKMCEVLKAKYPNPYIQVTGDATGNNRSGAVRDNITYWQSIQSSLRLHISQMHVPNVNPSVEDNKVLVNFVLGEAGWTVELDPEKNKELIKDLQYVELDAENNIIKDRSSANKYADFLDNFRYLVNAVAANDLRNRIGR